MQAGYSEEASKSLLHWSMQAAPAKEQRDSQKQRDPPLKSVPTDRLIKGTLFKKRGGDLYLETT